VNPLTGTGEPDRTQVLKHFKLNWKKKGKGKNKNILSTVNNTFPGSFMVFMSLTTVIQKHNIRWFVISFYWRG
jgi:hypothetical protein